MGPYLGIFEALLSFLESSEIVSVLDFRAHGFFLDQGSSGLLPLEKSLAVNL